MSAAGLDGPPKKSPQISHEQTMVHLLVLSISLFSFTEITKVTYVSLMQTLAEFKNKVVRQTRDALELRVHTAIALDAVARGPHLRCLCD